MAYMTRELGQQPGVQVNSILDETTLSQELVADRVIGFVGKFLRGPIHRPFVVNKGNLVRRLGTPEQIRVDERNQTYVHVAEALRIGIQAAVVQRYATSNATIGWGVIRRSEDLMTTNFASSVRVLALGQNPIGLGDMLIVMDDEQTDFLLAVKHLECHSDGIKLSYHAEEKRVGGVLVDSDMITLRIHDADGNVIWRFVGSLNPESLDFSGKSNYLPDVVSSATDLVEVVIGATGDDAVVKVGSDAYGFDDYGKQQWPVSDKLFTFVDGTDYQVADLLRVQQNMINTDLSYGHLVAPSCMDEREIAMMIEMSWQTGNPLSIDVPGAMSGDDAIAWIEQFDISNTNEPLAVRSFWAPIKRSCPSNVNPIGFYGFAAIGAAMACVRNSFLNGLGLPQKNHPVAGRDYAINVTGAKQVSFPDGAMLSRLAAARINPVLFQRFSDGQKLVFTDSLTSVGTESLSKLAAASDMAIHNNRAIAEKAADLAQRPLDGADGAIAAMSEYLTNLFAAEQSSGWLIPSSEPEMEGAAYKFSVTVNADRPYDAYDVNYYVRYCGTARAAYVSQTITK